MNQGWSGNECERAHTLTTTTTGSRNSQNEANIPTDYQSHNTLPPLPPQGPFFTGSWSHVRSSARHTISNQQAQLKRV